MRIVLDTNILVRAAASRTSPARELLDRILQRDEHTLILSAFLVDEIEDVLRRPFFRDRIPGLERLAFRAQLVAVSELVIPEGGPAVIQNDLADDMVLYTAAAGSADVICTRNSKHLGSGPATRFCADRGIRVLDDLELLAELRR